MFESETRAGPRAVTVDLAPTRMAFTVARIVLVAIIALGVAQDTFGRSWADVLIATAATIAVVIAIHDGHQHMAAKRKAAVTKSHKWFAIPWVRVALSSTLALGVIAAVSATSAPLAWVAMAVPVAEAAVVYGFARSVALWMALSLAHLASTLMSTPDQLFQAAQQLLAVLVVAAPGALLMNSIRSRVESLEEDREQAVAERARLMALSASLGHMGGQDRAADVLTSSVEGAINIGFDAADVVIKYPDQGWRHQATASSLFDAPIAASLLSDSALGTGKVLSLLPLTDESRQTLHLLGCRFGCAAPIGEEGTGVVLRAWSAHDMDDRDRVIDAFEMLADQATKMFATAAEGERTSIAAAHYAFAASHDPLTGLANRSHVIGVLSDLLATDERTVLFFLDLDGFKEINDGLGHQAGDAALISVADRLKELVGDRGLVGRMGGDEFVVLGRTADLAIDGQAIGMGPLLRDAVLTPFEFDGQPLAVGASIGVAASFPNEQADALIARADVAMYSAKRNQTGVCVWQESMGSGSHANTNLEAELTSERIA